MLSSILLAFNTLPRPSSIRMKRNEERGLLDSLSLACSGCVLCFSLMSTMSLIVVLFLV